MLDMKQALTPQLRKNLLTWYDDHKRDLPWRSISLELTNPYHVWLSEMMLQQTTVATVIKYFKDFIDKWPTLCHLAQASLDEVLTSWQGLGYYARARNLHKCAQLLMNEYGGIFPADPQTLSTLPGIGPYASAAIAAIAFNQPTVPVDGNVIRVLSRLYAINEPLPQSKNQIIHHAERLAHAHRSNDFAQALMELGALVCTPKNPRCTICPWQSFCKAHAEDEPEVYPKKARRGEKPTRYALAYVFTKNNSEIRLQKRQEQGLLGGMYEVPTTAWLADAEGVQTQGKEFLQTQPNAAYCGHVKHTFTHFHFKVDVYQISVQELTLDHPGVWVSLSELNNYALPTVMKKIIRAGLSQPI